MQKYQSLRERRKMENEMSAKDYLKQLRQLDCDITIQMLDLKKTEERISSLGAPQTEKVSTSGTADKTAALGMQLAELQQEAAKKCEEWAKLKIETLKVINRMDGKKGKQYQQVLSLYYLQNMTLSKTARIMRISYQWASSLRDEAVAEFDRLRHELGLCGVASDKHISHDTR